MHAKIESSLPPNPWSAPRGPADPTPVIYDGSRGRLFGLALGRMALTILTLGVGRFWMTTRLRRHYWASIRIDGSPLEYTGRAMEKLIGFLVAVVVLAVYLSLANLTLTFAGLAWLEGNIVGLQLPLLALLPALFWARYRARRYILARTRWRGVRFGLAPGAWGYAWRAMAWWGAAVASLGLLYPLTQHRLARYTTARSYFGDLRFAQEGGAGPLMRSWLWVWLPAAGLGALAAVYAARGEEPGQEAALAPLVLLFIAMGFVRHQVFSFRHLNSLKTLGGKTRFSVSLGFWRVVGIYISGALVIGLGVAATAALSSLAAAALIGDPAALFAALSEGRAPDLTGLLALALLAAAYLPAVAVWSALGHAFLTHPLLKAACAGVLIHDLDAAERARQRAHDEQAEAGGFADALGADLGGAF